MVLKKKCKLKICNIYNINEVKIQTQMYLSRLDGINKLLSEGNKVSGTLIEARKLAGSATYTQMKQALTVLSF